MKEKQKILKLSKPNSQQREVNCSFTKVNFFQKVRIVCQISKKDIPNHYPEIEI